ncbi:MAG: hypothetical protein HGB20_01910 [Chlorobiaceae bacterium]|nr:hypothetical protein [Chlorobiaceae bacterium]
MKLLKLQDKMTDVINLIISFVAEWLGRSLTVLLQKRVWTEGAVARKAGVYCSCDYHTNDRVGRNQCICRSVFSFRYVLFLSCSHIPAMLSFFCHSERSEESMKGDRRKWKLHCIAYSMTEHDVIPGRAKTPVVLVLEKDGSFTPQCFVQDDSSVSWISLRLNVAGAIKRELSEYYGV